MELKKETIGLKDLLLENVKYKTTYTNDYSCCTNVKGRKICISLGTQNLNTLINFISNPILILELENMNLEFDINTSIHSVLIECNGIQIDKLYNEHIMFLNSKFNLKADIVHNKVFIPLPFDFLNNGNGYLIYPQTKFDNKLDKNTINNINFWLEFSNYDFNDMIKNIYIRTEVNTFSNNIINEKKIKELYEKKLLLDYKFLLDYGDSDYIEKKIMDSKQITKYNFIQYHGEESKQNVKKQIIRLCYNYVIESLFIYFKNSLDLTLFHSIKQFEKLEIIFNGQIVLTKDYETLCFENSKEILGYELPKGVLEIKLDNLNSDIKNFSHIDNAILCIYDVAIPDNNSISICAYSTHYYIYKEDNIPIPLYY